MRNKVIGYRIGEFEGERREVYKSPADAGTILKPKWINKDKSEFDKLFSEANKKDKK
jgi:hypothetical protein